MSEHRYHPVQIQKQGGGGTGVTRDYPTYRVEGTTREQLKDILPTVEQLEIALETEAIAAADVVLIPVQPSPYDVWACQEVITLVNEALVFKPNLKSVFTINRKIVNTAIGRDVAEALAGYHVPVLKAQICQRVSFAESAATGQTVIETDPKGAATAEINALVNELLEV